MTKLAFIIRSLECGGAERQLVTLAKALDRKIFDVTILTFYSGGALEKELSGSGVRLIALDKQGRWRVKGFLGRLALQLRRIKPDVVHGYLDLSNVLALSAKLFLRRSAVVWGARSSDLDLSAYDWLRRFGFWLERKLSRYADYIIVNSEAGRSYLLKQGFRADKMAVVQNGIDTDYFRPSPDARTKIRAEWGVPDDATLIGLVARLEPTKDHATFLRAASLLSKVKSQARFVCVGSGSPAYHRDLVELAQRLGLSDKLIWAGWRSDMPDVYSALDLNVLSSKSEGCPNVVGEAMACGVPCVVTDAGDAPRIVGDTGFVSSRSDPQALADGMIACLEADRKTLGLEARSRIQKNWNVQQLCERTEKLLLTVAVPVNRPPISLFNPVDKDVDTLSIRVVNETASK